MTLPPIYAYPPGFPFVPGSTVSVDLGLVDLTSIMNGSQDLFTIPDGSYLKSLFFTDDTDTVIPDGIGQGGTVQAGSLYIWPALGTEKSFGWNGFAGISDQLGGSIQLSYDSSTLAAIGYGYGPFAALDVGTLDFNSLVLSAAAVGPVQVALLVSGLPTAGLVGAGVRVGPITAWAALTNYDSPASNTVATPGVLQSCAILANGTIWVNAGTTGLSGATTPDFAGNAGGSVADGADIVWYDTTSPPPTVGAVHVVAEIVTPWVP